MRIRERTISIINKVRIKLALHVASHRLHRKHFTIISNNCWGAHIYKALGRTYETPFVGLFIPPNHYIELLKNLDTLIFKPLKFVEQSRVKSFNELRLTKNLNYPIALLGNNVEIHFLHYRSASEASEKWQRRLSRINLDRSQLFIKFCDRDGCTLKNLRQFCNLRFPNKVCFTARSLPDLNSAVYISESQGQCVVDGLALAQISPRYFDAVAWINGSNPCNLLRCL